MTATYTTRDIPGQAFIIEEISSRPGDLAAAAKSAINSTGIAVFFALKLQAFDSDAAILGSTASDIQQRL